VATKKRAAPRRLTLLIDADVLAYNASAGEQQVYQWDDEVASVRMGTIEDAIEVVHRYLEHFKEKFNASHLALCLTDEDNFRKHVYPPYKSNRPAKPLLLPEVRKYMMEKLGAYKRKGLEGDDVMGILATHPKLIPGPKMIVSVDKDMLQIPGKVYRPHKDEVVDVTPEQGEHFFYYQTICGDPTDHYPGIKGIGDVGARKLLDADRSEWWSRMLVAATHKGMTEDALLVQARVAKILQHTDFNYHTKEPILWTPQPS
jgi:DNA polymerase-1